MLNIMYGLYVAVTRSGLANNTVSLYREFIRHYNHIRIFNNNWCKSILQKYNTSRHSELCIAPSWYKSSKDAICYMFTVNSKVIQPVSLIRSHYQTEQLIWEAITYIDVLGILRLLCIDIVVLNILTVEKTVSINSL